MKKLGAYLKKNWFMTLLVFLLTVSCVLLYVSFLHERKIRKGLEQFDVVDTNGTFIREYYEEEISALKHKNKALYDSIYAYKDKVSYLIQFKYEKQYDTGKVETEKKKDSVVVNDTIKEFQYANELNDTMQYNLTVASIEEPDWYRLRVKVSDRFTIINKEDGNGHNTISIGGENHGDISDVTTFKKKENKSFFNRFAIGPTASFGYDPQNKRFSPVIGIGVTFDIIK